MTIFFRILRLLALTAWIGGIFFFSFAVARVAFASLAPHDAGTIVRGTLSALHHVGLVAGAIFLLATLTLIATQRDSHILRAVEVLVVVVMLGLTAYSQYSVIPRMEADRLILGGDVVTAPQSATHQHFDRLHNLSVKVEATILFAGVFLLCLAPIHQRANRLD